jgi:hypothetical protein
MAIISSYPTITPKLADKVLGSNNVDSYNDPVPGNPTVQYSMESVKTLVDQDFIEQINTSRLTSYTPPRDNVGEPLIFGDVTLGGNASNTKYDHTTGQITFNTTGTYYIQQYYLSSSVGDSQPYILFKTMQNATSQIGPTVVERWNSPNSADRHRIMVENIVNITIAGTYYYIWSCNPEDGAEASLTLQNVGGFGTDTPSAQLIISKLI